ncbi:MAG: hypothetical protein ACKO3H_01225, partial [Verrucomicrobiota bacterium]
LTTFERHARREGLEQGRQEGLATGLERGQQRGRQDGLREGWVEALKASASVRFPDWEPSWDRILEAVDDPNLLRVWHRLLLTVPSGEEFLKSIGKQPR